MSPTSVPGNPPAKNPPLPPARSQRWADAIVRELTPLCARLEVAGSVRRRRPQCHDIDIVCIPLREESKDLFGAPASADNRVLEWARAYVARAAGPCPGPGEQTPRIISGGERAGKQLLLQLRSCQLDLWFADEPNFASRLLCRTGSKEHNIWLASRCAARGLHWFPYEGISSMSALRERQINPLSQGAAEAAAAAGLILPAGAETDLYGYTGMEFVVPENRELPWLQKNIYAEL